MRMSQPGPDDQAHLPAWRRWLLPLGTIAVLLALFALPHGGPPGSPRRGGSGIWRSPGVSGTSGS